MTAPGFVGADPEQLAALAERLEHGAQSLDAIHAQVGGTIGKVHWEGHDGDQLRDDWRSRHATVITAACAALRDAAQALRRNAGEQTGASGAAGASLTAAGATSVYQPEAFDLLHGIRDVVEGGKALTFTTDLLGEVSKDHTIANVHDLAKVAGHIKVGALDAFAIGLDVGQLGTELLNGDMQWSTVRQTAWDAAGIIPPIGAWQTGAFIGEQMANVLEDRTHYQEAIFDGIVADRYDGPLTPTQADDLVQRYSGPTAYLNITQDLVTSEAHSIGDGAKALWNKVF